MAAKKRWYAMAAKTQGGERVAEIRIYGDIGFWGMTAKDFMAEIDEVADGAAGIVVSINSYGGDVFDAFAIYNALRRHALPVTTRVDGVAASAASLILMAGDTIVMPENAMIMIHNTWTVAGGTAKDLREVADMMDKVRDGIVAAYTAKSDKSDAEIIEMLDATTWMTALEAQALGFCDLIEEPVKLAASSNMPALLAKYKNVPDHILAIMEDDASVSGQDAATVPDPSSTPTKAAGPAAPHPVDVAALTAHVFASCREHGISAMAEGILMSGGLASQADADARIAQAQEIAGLCLAAKLPDTGADYIKAGLNVEQVRARLFDHVVQDAAGVISNLQRPQESPQAQGGPNARNIYAARAVSKQATQRP